MPFWGRTSNGNGTTSSSSLSSSSTSSSSINSGNNNNNSNPNNPPIPEDNQQQQQQLPVGDNAPSLSYYSTNAVLFMTRSLLPTRRRLKLDPTNKLYFPYEPGKQVRSAIGIKNISKSNVAFKFQTTSPKSCYMRPPGAILSPGESLIATVFKFMEPPENNENPLDQKTRVKFKIMSLKVKGDVEYVPEMFDALKDQVAVEQILRVVFLDPECPSPALDKLKRQLAEAEAEVEARKKPSEHEISQEMREGLVIDEWKERRERYLARQHHEIDSA